MDTNLENLSTEELFIEEQLNEGFKEKKLKEEYLNTTEKVREIINLITDYYGEDRVDAELMPFEDYKALTYFTHDFVPVTIWFPEVTVTNEIGEHTTVHDLFVKFSIYFDGYLTSKFTMATTTFTRDQFNCGYMHSHLPSFSSVPSFTNPCLGSGPIVSTQNKLLRTSSSACSPDDLLDFWGLYLLEIDKYVRVESLKGGPYIELRNIGSLVKTNETKTDIDIPLDPMLFIKWKKVLVLFIKYLCKSNKLRFVWVNNHYDFAESINRLRLDISNLFISWANNKYGSEPDYRLDTKSNFLVKRIITQTSIYRKGFINKRIDPNHIVLTFKEKPIKIKIIEDNNEVDNSVYVLQDGIFRWIINSILKVINYNYGRNETKKANERVDYY